MDLQEIERQASPASAKLLRLARQPPSPYADEAKAAFTAHREWPEGPRLNQYERRLIAEDD